MDLTGLGRVILGIGVFLVLLGAVLMFAGKIPGLGGLGRLPGDIFVKRDNFSFYFPVTTSILLSIVLSLLAWLFFRK
jgi:hypothetical protein